MFERIFIAGKPRQRRSSFRSVRTWSLLRGSVLPPASTPGAVLPPISTPGAGPV